MNITNFLDTDPIFISVPTWEKGIWSKTDFLTREEFERFVFSTFKEPSKYEFDETTLLFNEQARNYDRLGYFSNTRQGTKDFRVYWDDQKDKNRNGVIFKNNGKTWYLPRAYYMWINFLPINDKLKKKFAFPQVWDTQLHIALYECLAELNFEHAAVFKKRQIASEQPHSEPILTVDGWRTMGDVQIGDMLWNPDGTLTKILAKSNNGLSDVYEFIFGDGRSTRCGIEHNWEVYDRLRKKEIVLNTQQLLDYGLFHKTTAPVKGGKKEYNSYRFAIKYTNPINFLDTCRLEIDPYVLGCLIGDGSIKGNSISITSADIEIVDTIQQRIGEDYMIKSNFTKGKASRYGISYKGRFSEKCKEYHNGQYGCNPISRYLEEIGLKDKICTDKFIPDIYLNSTVENRIELLKGLMDTDGYINATGKDIHYTTVSHQLARDVAYLTGSLGIKTVIDKKSKAKSTQSDYYRVRLSGHIPFNIFHLFRKAKRFDIRTDSFPLCPIISITKLDYQEESSCIIVDNPNRLYITKDFIVTHNSYFHCATIINLLWFEESPIIKMGASNKDYVNNKGSWKFLEEYRSFLNDKTAWYRPMNPSGEGLWQQKIDETSVDGRTSSKGLKGMVQTVTFEQKPENGVGGAMRFFFYEEGGIAPTANLTYQYIRPGMQMGNITTGLFVIAGSVGELDKCEPLKQFIYNPDDYQIYAVESNLLNDKGTTAKTGLFIPEQWSMPPFIDKWGNSMVKEALESLELSFAELKKKLPPRDYQLAISQRPRTIEEGFASRAVSIFPLHLINAQKRRIEEKQYSQEFIDLKRDATGKIEVVKSNKIPIDEFPITKTQVDKTGTIVIYERPDEDSEWGTYYASVDPVAEGKSTSSESLCSIYVYKNPVQVTRIKRGEAENFLEGDKIVATWCGRFDDLNKTHERLELLIEWYNAWTIVENNISLFIRHMIDKKKQRYLVPKDQITFLKDLGANKNVYQDYGWKNTGTLFKEDMLNYLLAFLQEEIDVETKENGDIVKRTYGIERIPDIMAMKEMSEYVHGLNVDRVISLAALVAFAKVQQANRGYKKRVEYIDQKDLDKSKDLYTLKVSPFKNRHNNPGLGTNRNPFKNIR